MPFIRNTTLTVKSHICNTKRREKQAVGPPMQGRSNDMALSRGKGDREGVFLGSSDSQPLRRE